MKKLKVGLLIMGLVLFVSTFVISQKLKNEREPEIKQDGIVLVAEYQVQEASIGDFIKDFSWGELITLLFAGGFLTIITAVRKALGEMKDVKVKFLQYRVDGFTKDEKEDLINELGEAILAVDSVWMILKNLFKGVKKKE